MVEARLGAGFLTRTLLTNVVVVPLLAIALVRAVPLPTEVMLGIVLVAALPGGVDFLPLAIRPRRPSREHIALVFVLSLVAVGITPALRHALELFGAAPVASYWRVIWVAVLAVLLPLAGGLLIRRTSPAAADTLARVMGIVSALLFVAAALTTLLVKPHAVRAVGIRGLAVMILLVAGAAGAGWLLGGPSSSRRALLAHVTRMRNAGLSLVVAIVSFPDAPVDVVVIVFIVVELALRVGTRLIRRGGTQAPRTSTRGDELPTTGAVV
jgi:BASS family bile acid:Na+ symporter